MWWLTLVAGALLMTGCALPSLNLRVPSSSLKETADTRLGRAITPKLLAHPSESGIYTLTGARDAFAARVLLADAAERSIDAQYYIWHADRTGKLLFEALWRAADRGVRVRLLIDDNTTTGLDPTLAALSAHKNIELRLFNPLVNRGVRWSNYFFDFSRLNHRMHNKSFTVDNQVTIVGGRNIGDEYFDAGTRLSYIDMDVLAVGPVVQEVSDQFDLYWNSASAYPAGMLLEQPPPDSAEHLTTTFAATPVDPLAAQYLAALRETQIVTDLGQGELPLEWTKARLVYDDPAKALDTKQQREDILLLARLLAMTAPPTSEFDLISPYFVPRSRGGGDLEGLARRGVRVRVLTNSLESTDVIAVHAGYIKYRKDLLQAGVKLYELQRKELPQRSDAERKAGVRSATGLHAKTFQIDSKVAFVGSFNFDPRSARLNTEMGVVIDSASLAQRITQFFDSRITSAAYQLRLSEKNDIQWTATTADGLKVYDTEPGTSTGRRAKVRFLAILPIEGLL